MPQFAFPSDKKVSRFLHPHGPSPSLQWSYLGAMTIKSLSNEKDKRIHGDDISSVPWNYSGRVAPARIGVNHLSGGHEFGGYTVT
jgi:hypothetical protein